MYKLTSKHIKIVIRINKSELKLSLRSGEIRDKSLEQFHILIITWKKKGGIRVFVSDRWNWKDIEQEREREREKERWTYGDEFGRRKRSEGGGEWGWGSS